MRRNVGVFVDTGMNTGMVVGCTDGLEILQYSVLRPPQRFSGKSAETKLKYMIEQFAVTMASFMAEYTVGVLWIEGVEMWGQSETSMTAATTGDLFTLSYMAGGYFAVGTFLEIPVVNIIPARTWKGQLPKDAIHDRIARRLHGEKYPEHAADGVGMYLSYRGVL